MTDSSNHIIRVLSTLADIPATRWDRLANPGWILSERGRLESSHQAERTSAPTGATKPLTGGADPRPPESKLQEPESKREETTFNPFISNAFLYTLEESGCAAPRTDWLAQHLLLEDEDGSPLAAAPCYVKTHSQGEYVFDYGWADAFERTGGRYYPKLQISVPFTPATGRRLLVGPDIDRDTGRAVLAAGLHQLCDQLGPSSVHLTFLPKDEAEFLDRDDFLIRTDRQFHWTNRGYETFDDFLSTLASRKRKAVRRERREALQNDITIEWLTGKDITEDHWDAFYEFYMDTGSGKWGRPYLNRTFFSMLGERILLVMARRDGHYIAGALNMIGSDTLYDRYWGCTEDHPFLHFELCYHQAIDYAISHRLRRVKAGAQGAQQARPRNTCPRRPGRPTGSPIPACTVRLRIT